jgi:hypothetical protein
MIPFLKPNGGDYEDIDDIEETLEDDEETDVGWAHRTLSKNKKPRIESVHVVVRFTAVEL